MKKIISLSLVALFGLVSLQSCKKNNPTVGVTETETISNRQTLVSNENNIGTLLLADNNFVTEKYGEIQLEELAKGNEVYDFKFTRVWISTITLTDFSHVTFEDTPRDLDVLVDLFDLVVTPDLYSTANQEILITNKLGTSTPIEPNFDIAAYADLNPDFALKLVVHFNTEFDGPRSLDSEISIGYSYDYVTRPIKD